MSASTAQALTQQFYDWERRGRGWYKAEFSCDLEPPFEPFYGHFIERESIIDDGKRHTWLSSLFSQPPPTPVPEHEEEPVRAYEYKDESPLCVCQVVLPRNYRPSTERMEQLLVMLSYRKSPMSFEIVGAFDKVTLQFTCREPDEQFLHTQLQAFFPEFTIIDKGDDMLFEAVYTELPLYTVDFGLQDEFMRPIATQRGGDTDSLTAFFGTLSRLKENQYAMLQVLFSGTHNSWAESIMTAVCDAGGRQSFFFDDPEMPHLAREKVSQPLYGVSIRVVTMADSLQFAEQLLHHTVTALVHATRGSNSIMPLSDAAYNVNERLWDIVMRQSHRVGMLLSVKELATLAHFPPVSLSGKLLAGHGNTKAAPPHLVGEKYCLGVNEHQGVGQEVGIGPEQRLRHVHIIGATGTGKSTLLRSLIMQDIESDKGLCVIDPHGDLIDTLLKSIPDNRVQDVVLIDPTDSEYPIGLNILLAHSDLEKELLASDLVALFRRFSTSWGDQMNSVFANAISAFVYNKHVGTLGDLRKFLIEQPFRNEMLSTCTDPDIVYYWQKEYPILKSSSIGSILTRLDSFLRPKVIRNMVCQKQSLNFKELMDSNKIVLVKLSQGLLGEENSYLLGAFIVSKLQQTAMARQAQVQESRVPFYCYIDEFQHFVTPSMATILSGARKYSQGLILAHQDMQQVSRIDADIANSVIANAGTRICFRLGDTDAKRMQEGFSAFTQEDLQSPSTGEAIVRVSTREQDFNIAVLPYEETDTDNKAMVIAHSRAAYGVPIISPVESSQDQVPIPPQAENTSQAAPIMDEPQQKEIREHRYLQTFIKKLGEEYGYRANIEVSTPDSKGMVDVLLEKEGQQIAVEISVTTTAVWELHNVKKCLGAGYAMVAVCSTSPTKILQIQSLMQAELSSVERERVRILSPDNLQTLFSKEQPKNEPTATVMKGYRVKVKYEQSGGNAKNEIINRIINSKKGDK